MLQFDLFASRLNKQFTQYVSYRPDPFAFYINAFTISWGDKQCYCFPPVSCILQVIWKIISNKGRGILLVPYWPTQTSFLMLTAILEQPPMILQPLKTLLVMPSNKEKIHPLLSVCYHPISLSPPQRLLFFKKTRIRGKGGKKGKAEKERGKGGKRAREREKRRKPLPDFCRNMAKVVDIRPHTA